MDKKSDAAIQWIQSRACEDTVNPEWPIAVYFLIDLVTENARKGTVAAEENGEQRE
ncbi:hypothetical protein [Enterovibrio norvegicus]|uniref:hypothetical protein n=1 Tax=Enterovibrio norvegicus TaxID=188144 RepID=UPI001304124A|nr:hypothetical protein [Enterovibrio norvegicus]